MTAGQILAAEEAAMIRHICMFKLKDEDKESKFEGGTAPFGGDERDSPDCNV